LSAATPVTKTIFNLDGMSRRDKERRYRSHWNPWIVFCGVVCLVWLVFLHIFPSSSNSGSITSVTISTAKSKHTSVNNESNNMISYILVEKGTGLLRYAAQEPNNPIVMDRLLEMFP
jgi:hypothetical protein